MRTRRSRNQPPPSAAYTDETIVMRRNKPAPARAKSPGPRFWRRVRLVLLAVLALLVLVVGLLYWQVHRLSTAITVADPRANPSLATPLIGANVLIVGVDERPDNPEEGVRSDTLILARLDAADGWVSLLSIPRDTQVELRDIGPSKINAAYGQGYARAQEFYGSEVSAPQGGMAHAAEVAENFLRLRDRGMRVDYVAQVNFEGFAAVIDALGGVTIDVPRLLIDDEYPTPDFGTMRVEFQPGPQLMDGERALIYARMRHPDSDFGRAERQQQVIRAILSEFKNRSAVGRALAVPALLNAVGGDDGSPPVLTTLPIDRPDVLLGLLGLAGGLDPDSIGQFRLTPEEVTVFENGSNLIWDDAGVQALLDRFVAPPNEAQEQATVQVFNGTETAGLARQVTLELEGAGFRILTPDNAPPGAYGRTTVYNTNNKPATARRLARTLNAELVNGPAAGIASAADIVVILGNNAVP